MSKKPAKENLSPRIANRRATHDYHIIEKLEVGIILHGHEVKSVRHGQVVLSDGYALIDPRTGKLELHGVEIARYAHAGGATLDDYQPKRKRQLLAHKRQINNLGNALGAKGLTLVPLAMYFVRGKVKVELGLGQGKKAYDKRQSLKKKEADRDIQRAMSRRM